MQLRITNFIDQKVLSSTKKKKTPDPIQKGVQDANSLNLFPLTNFRSKEAESISVWFVDSYMAQARKCILFVYKHQFISCLDLSKAQRSFANVLNGFGLECIGEVETDDEMIIGELNL